MIALNSPIVCRILHCAQVLSNVPGCSSLYEGVPHYAQLFPTVHRCFHWCSPWCAVIPPLSVAFYTVHGCSTLYAGVLTIHRCSPLCTGVSTVHGCYPLCEGIPHCAQLLHIVYLCSPLCVGVSHCAQVFPLCTDVPYCARLFPAVSTVGHASAHLVTTMHSGNTHAQ